MPKLRQILSPSQKALTINLRDDIYGNFSEIGAGQETVRFFFRAGASSHTIAKAMSAYDKDYSDAIYGKEPNNRYVSQARLIKMLDHETALMEERIDRKAYPNRKFFSYANTVTTIDYKKTNKGHGWVGIRFQLDESEPYNEIILHLRFHENDSRLQQVTLGVLGTNLIYGAYFYGDDPRTIIESLYDELERDQIEIDMINFNGPRYANVDNRLMSLQLVKNGMTEAVVFSPQGINILPADELYKKNIFAVRGSFRPVNNINIDMFERGLELFQKENNSSPDEIRVLFEITLANLRASGEINERDFLDRADILSKLGYTVLISNFSEYYRLVDYFGRLTKGKIGISMGASILDIFDENYYTHLDGGIMEAFGKLFRKNVQIYLYPFFGLDRKEILTSENLKVDDNLKDLYKYFKANGKFIDIKDYNENYLSISGKRILGQIVMGESGWEDKVPKIVADMIKEHGMFGYFKGFTD